MVLLGTSEARPRSGRAMPSTEDRRPRHRRRLKISSRRPRRPAGCGRPTVPDRCHGHSRTQCVFRPVKSGDVSSWRAFLIPLLARLRELVLRADPVLTNLFNIVLLCSCRISHFHGAAVGYGRKFSMTQTSLLYFPAVKAMRRPSGCRDICFTLNPKSSLRSSPPVAGILHNSSGLSVSHGPTIT